MKRTLLVSLVVSISCAMVPYALGDDEAACMDCHEPAEDWEGMSCDEIIVEARNPDNRRHKDNSALSDEQLEAIIANLLEE
jgi:hypothetical protein